MMISAGSLAGMAGTQVYRPDDAPRYRTIYTYTYNTKKDMSALSRTSILIEALPISLRSSVA